MNWSALKQFHSEVAAELVSAAQGVPPQKWLVPRDEGKWCPAQVVEHLNLAYDVLLRELAGGEGMKIRTKFLRRMLLRWTIMPRLMRGAPFPPGVPAPREIRGPVANADQAAAIAAFAERAVRFEAAAAQAQEKGGVRLTHAYFGKSSVEQGILLCAQHVRHHRKQLLE
jgi:hypothetical protein